MIAWDHERCAGVNHHGMRCKKPRKALLNGEKLVFCASHNKLDKPMRVYPSDAQLAGMSVVLRAEYDTP